MARAAPKKQQLPEQPVERIVVHSMRELMHALAYQIIDPETTTPPVTREIMHAIGLGVLTVIDEVNSAETKAAIVEARLALEVQLYNDYMTRNRRARLSDVVGYIIDELKKEEKKGASSSIRIRAVSYYQITSRDFRDLRKDGRIPKRHCIPFIPTP
jgi:hypothetical protein